MSNLKNKKYILYGASFNPPHIGHFSAISQMLEEYDTVIIFPYPKKYVDGRQEILPNINQRMKMLELFCGEFFPKVSNRLYLINLASEINVGNNDVIHTYDYLNYIKQKLPNSSNLSVCLGFDAQYFLRKESFYNEDLIKKEFSPFYLQEENAIKSEDLRKFFTSHKNIKSKKDEEYIKYAVGNSLSEYIFNNNLYGLKKKNENKVDALLSSRTKKMKI